MAASLPFITLKIIMSTLWFIDYIEIDLKTQIKIHRIYLGKRLHISRQISFL